MKFKRCRYYLAMRSLSSDEQALLGFALAAVMERRGLFDQAADYLVAANEHHSAAKAARGLSCDLRRPHPIDRSDDWHFHGRLPRGPPRLGHC